MSSIVRFVSYASLQDQNFFVVSVSDRLPVNLFGIAVELRLRPARPTALRKE